MMAIILAIPPDLSSREERPGIQERHPVKVIGTQEELVADELLMGISESGWLDLRRQSRGTPLAVTSG
jgi:hypothetical protein